MNFKMAYCFFLLVVAGISCEGCEQMTGRSHSHTYRPLGIVTPQDDASMRIIFREAKASSSPEEAISLWLKVIEYYPDGERSWNDNIDRLYYNAAALELARAYYLSGQAEQGDYWLRISLADAVSFE